MLSLVWIIHALKKEESGISGLGVKEKNQFFSSNMYFIYLSHSLTLTIFRLIFLHHKSHHWMPFLAACLIIHSHQYISYVTRRRRRKRFIFIQSVIALAVFLLSLQQQTVEIWMNFWFRSISQCTCLNFPSFFFERTFLPFFSSSSSIYIILFCEQKYEKSWQS